MKKKPIRLLTAGVLGSALLALAALSGARYSSEIRAARERLGAWPSQVIDTPCGPIEYATAGQGSPVLVVHGNGGGFDQGLLLAQSYLDQGFQVIAPSRFGYLGSPVPPDATPALQADTFACLLDALGLQKVAVFTSSAGVTSTIELALRHPERVSAIVLHSPNAPGEPGLALPPRPVFSALVHSDYGFWALSAYFRPLMQSLVGVPKDFILTPQYQADIAATLANSLPVSLRGEGILFDSFVSNPVINQLPLADVTVPTLVISAVDDPMALHSTARTLAESIPSAQLLAIPDGGHMMLGHTAEVRVAITQFLGSAAVALSLP